jgi:hypothetical protein
MGLQPCTYASRRTRTILLLFSDSKFALHWSSYRGQKHLERKQQAASSARGELAVLITSGNRSHLVETLESSMD